MKIALVFAAVFLAGVIGQAFGKIIMSHSDAVTNPDYAHMDINVKNQTAVIFDVSADTHRIIDGKIKMEIELLKKSTESYRSLLVLTVRNICEILNHRSETPLIDLIIQIVSQYGIIPQSCPMEKGHYYLKDFLLPDFVFDMLLSSGYYQIKVEFVDENDVVPVSIHKSTYSAIMTQEPSIDKKNLKKAMQMLQK